MNQTSAITFLSNGPLGSSFKTCLLSIPIRNHQLRLSTSTQITREIKFFSACVMSHALLYIYIQRSSRSRQSSPLFSEMKIEQFNESYVHIWPYLLQ